MQTIHCCDHIRINTDLRFIGHQSLIDGVGLLYQCDICRNSFIIGKTDEQEMIEYLKKRQQDLLNSVQF